LSFWCRQYAEQYDDGLGFDAERRKQAESAIRAIGTNAIPTLLHMLQAKDSNLKLTLVRIAQNRTFSESDLHRLRPDIPKRYPDFSL
jgi:hypothetical protein